MKIQKAETVISVPVEVEGAQDVEIRILVGPEDGAPNFNMREFTIAPGGCTPKHSHAWEHEVYVLAGEGEVTTAGGDKAISADDCIFVPPNEIHQFRNTGESELKFLCLVPQSATG